MSLLCAIKKSKTIDRWRYNYCLRLHLLWWLSFRWINAPHFSHSNLSAVCERMCLLKNHLSLNVPSHPGHEHFSSFVSILVVVLSELTDVVVGPQFFKWRFMLLLRINLWQFWQLICLCFPDFPAIVKRVKVVAKYKSYFDGFKVNFLNTLSRGTSW